MSNAGSKKIGDGKFISARIAAVRPSATIAVGEKASALQSAGKDVISLSMGEPDFDTPDHIKEAAVGAIRKGKTKYTAVTGISALKDAVIGKLKEVNSLDYSRDEVIISSGAKQVLYNVLGASLNSGDEVIVPSPYWVSYVDMVRIFDGEPIIAPTSAKFVLDPGILESLITPKTKWLILNFPNNPTGACPTLQELQSLAAVLLKYPDVHIISDDIYEYIVYDGCISHNIASVEPKLKDRVFIVNGVSKSYSMTGWRIGYGAGDAKLIKAMSTIQSQSTSCPCSISQEAALSALTGSCSFLGRWLSEFESRRNMVLEKLNQVDGLTCEKPSGAFYLFPSIEKLLGKKTPSGQVLKNDIDFTNYLISEYLVAAVPGSAFGAKNHFRISYATSEVLLLKACSRIQEACEVLV